MLARGSEAIACLLWLASPIMSLTFSFKPRATSLCTSCPKSHLLLIPADTPPTYPSSPSCLSWLMPSSHCNINQPFLSSPRGA